MGVSKARTRTVSLSGSPVMETNSTISPSVDPTMADAIADQLTIGTNADGSPVYSPAFTAGRATLAKLHESSLALADAEAGIKRAGMTDPVTADRLRNAARKTMAAIAKSVESGLAALTANHDQCTAEIEAAIGTEQSRTGVCENARGAEIRSWVRSLPTPSARTDALLAAIREGEREIVAAVLAAPAALSGIKPDARENLAAEAAERFAPASTKMRASIDKMRSMLQIAASATGQRFAATTGFGESVAAVAQRSLTALENAGGAA